MVFFVGPRPEYHDLCTAKLQSGCWDYAKRLCHTTKTCNDVKCGHTTPQLKWPSSSSLVPGICKCDGLRRSSVKYHFNCLFTSTSYTEDEPVFYESLMLGWISLILQLCIGINEWSSADATRTKLRTLSTYPIRPDFQACSHRVWLDDFGWCKALILTGLVYRSKPPDTKPKEKMVR